MQTNKFPVQISVNIINLILTKMNKRVGVHPNTHQHVHKWITLTVSAYAGEAKRRTCQRENQISEEQLHDISVVMSFLYFIFLLISIISIGYWFLKKYIIKVNLHIKNVIKKNKPAYYQYTYNQFAYNRL